MHRKKIKKYELITMWRVLIKFTVHLMIVDANECV